MNEIAHTFGKGSYEFHCFTHQETKEASMNGNYLLNQTDFRVIVIIHGQIHTKVLLRTAFTKERTLFEL